MSGPKVGDKHNVMTSVHWRYFFINEMSQRRL